MKNNKIINLLLPLVHISNKWGERWLCGRLTKDQWLAKVIEDSLKLVINL